MRKGELLYQGKAKSVYRTDEADMYIMEYRNDTSAFDGAKKASLDRKGEVNNRINAFVMERLAAAGIPVHHRGLLDATHSQVRRLEMVPVECVVRNVAAGSLARRLGIPEGRPLDPPTYELFLKNDALHDPMINESHALTFGWATQQQLDEMKALTLRINGILRKLFDAAGMTLVDYKLEFGVADGALMLGDEFSPDGCRIWDKATGEKMDKDRFRQDLGQVIDYYEEVARRLGVTLGDAR